MLSWSWVRFCASSYGCLVVHKYPDGTGAGVCLYPVSGKYCCLQERRCFRWMREHYLPEGTSFGQEVYCLLSLEVEDWCSLYSSGFGVFVGSEHVLSLG